MKSLSEASEVRCTSSAAWRTLVGETPPETVTGWFSRAAFWMDSTRRPELPSNRPEALRLVVGVFSCWAGPVVPAAGASTGPAAMVSKEEWSP
ncbi:MAG: hypothetical protein QM765_01510 [Myxococcales bacterium]